MRKKCISYFDQKLKSYNFIIFNIHLQINPMNFFRNLLTIMDLFENENYSKLLSENNLKSRK